jgi:hypothetical protein
MSKEDERSGSSPEGGAMKRLLFGLGVGLALAPTTGSAQDGAPAARLGSPAATLGRPVVRGQMPVVTTSLQPDGTPKEMPKGKVTEPDKKEPPTLPMPGATPTGPALGTPPPGTVYGPVIVDPPGAPIPGGPPFDGGAGNACPIPGYGESRLDRWYTSAEALVWFAKSFSTPVLLAAGPTNVPAVSLGALGSPGGAVPVYGGDSIDTNPWYGGRVTLGYWFSPRWAIEANALYFFPRTETFSASSGDFPNSALGRPFFSANRNAEAAELIGFPGAIVGSYSSEVKSQLYGGELNLRRRWWDTCNSRLDFIGGYRFLRLEESLVINESAEVTAGQFAGLAGTVRDEFRTRNQFHGVQIGAVYDRTWGNWTWSLWGKVGVGITQHSVDISGTSQFQNGTGTDRPGGLLALDSNIGGYKKNTFSVVPEVGLNVGYNVTERLRVFAGYSFLYWSNVARPGKQIDRTLDENRIPEFTALRTAAGVAPPPAATTVRPVGRVETESFWAQGFNFGLQFRW